MKQQSSRGATAFLFLFTALVMAMALPLRVWQQLHAVETLTGFWRIGGGGTAVFLYIAVGLLVAVPAAAAFYRRRLLVLDLGRRPRAAEGALSLLAAAAAVAGALLALQFALRLFSGSIVLEGIEHQAGGSVWQYYVRSGALAALCEGLFGLGAAAFFTNLAMVDLLPAKKVFLNRLFALAPVLWTIFRILRRFSRTIAYLRVSDLFLTLAALTALMVFFLAFAQLVSGINNGGKEWVLAAGGIPAAALLLLAFVPRLIVYKFIGGPEPSQDAVLEWCDPVFAVFILVFLGARLLRREGDSVKALPEEEA